jgi:acetolactate synthase II small subunit
MNCQLDLTLRKSERVLERVLGLMGRRGYDVATLQSRPTADGTSLDVAVTIVSDRPVEILTRQLAKLPDVIRVESGMRA